LNKLESRPFGFPDGLTYVKTRYAPFYPSYNKVFVDDDSNNDYKRLPGQLRLTSVNDDVPTSIDATDPREGFFIEFEVPAFRSPNNAETSHDI